MSCHSVPFWVDVARFSDVSHAHAGSPSVLLHDMYWGQSYLRVR